MKKRIAMILLFSVLMVGCMASRGYWIAFMDKSKEGYYHIYDDPRSEIYGPYRMLKPNARFVAKKESSKKTNQWTIDYYKFEKRKKHEFEIGSSALMSGVTLPKCDTSH